VNGKAAHLTHEIMIRLLWWAKASEISWEQFWVWAQQKNNTLVYYRKQCREWNSKTFYTVTDTFVYNLARKAYGEKIVRNSVEEQMKRYFDVKVTRWLEDRRYLKSSDIYKSTKSIILGGGCGSNKTGYSLDFILRAILFNPYIQILWVVPKIALASDTIGRAQVLGISVYSHTAGGEQPPGSTNMTLWSVQSLHKLGGDRHFDIVVLDEVETLLKSFDGDCTTHQSHLSSNWALLKEFCTKADQVLALDAYITKTSFDFFTALKKRNDSLAVIDSKVKAPKIQLHYEPVDKSGCATLIGSLVKKLKLGKKVFIYVPYKMTNKSVSTGWVVDVVSQKFGWKRGKEILMYNEDTQAEKKRLEKCDEVWSNTEVRLVVCNSSIAVGVSFSLPDAFDHVMGYYACCLSLRDFFQTLFRVRLPKSRKMHVVLDCSIIFKQVSGIYNPPIVGPDCPVFRQLRKNMMIEFRADGLMSTCRLFAAKANMELKTSSFEKAREVGEEILEAFEEGIIYNRKNIEKIDSDTEALLSTLRLSSTGITFEDKLKLHRYYFEQHFLSDTAESIIDKAW
jgi:hypothetical protein